MAALQVFQIFYSEATRAALDPGFIPLDNMANERPDWREYWPIRNYLLANDLRDDCYYGFFSPKFKEKTGLDAAAVRRFVDECDGVDVIIFSPFWDQISFFRNTFEQGEVAHPGMIAAATDALAEVGEAVNLSGLTTDSRNTVYSNFFVARPAFWRAWLDLNERLFALADGNPDCSLNRLASHHIAVPYKVFLMERIATLLLATRPAWTCRAYNPFSLHSSASVVAKMSFECVLCDALKIAYQVQGYSQYLNAFSNLRQSMYSQLPRDGKGGVLI